MLANANNLYYLLKYLYKYEFNEVENGDKRKKWY